MSRQNWFDEQQAPQIENYARNLESYVAAMADGRIDAHEVQAQEARLVALMREIEPLLDDGLHAKVTQLLCELTAYDMMQMLHELQQSRPRTQFRG